MDLYSISKISLIAQCAAAVVTHRFFRSRPEYHSIALESASISEFVAPNSSLAHITFKKFSLFRACGMLTIGLSGSGSLGLFVASRSSTRSFPCVRKPTMFNSYLILHIDSCSPGFSPLRGMSSPYAHKKKRHLGYFATPKRILLLPISLFLFKRNAPYRYVDKLCTSFSCDSLCKHSFTSTGRWCCPYSLPGLGHMSFAEAASPIPLNEVHTNLWVSEAVTEPAYPLSAPQRVLCLK